MQLQVVIAPDSFKGTLGAAKAAAAIAEGWLSVRPHDHITELPQADGGEGTLDAIEAAVPGAVRRSAGQVEGPDGRLVRGEWIELPGGTGVVELAQVSGLPLMSSPDPLGASTYGLGEVIESALGTGIQRLVIGLGGSASTDGGAGALSALGLRQASGEHLPRGGSGLASIGALDISQLIPPPSGGVLLLSDVSSPLLGERGAAAVFGPQKGASYAEVLKLELALAHFAGLLGGDPTVPGAGAAGGTGYGFLAAWSAGMVSGADYIARATGLPAAVTEADVLLTGEGRFDATSGEGKVVGQVLRLASGLAMKTGVVAGLLDAEPRMPDATRAWSLSLSQLAGSTGSAMADPARWLREAGAEAARQLG
ncbi:MAG: Glycerate kinase [Microbacteriaceae bacterium]|nr:Glycerate kinase [Microbacteriaceae bacterium]